MIYHLLPGRAEHHVPVIMQFFLDIQEEVRSPIDTHVFVFYGASPGQLLLYSQKLPPDCRTMAINAGKKPLLRFLLGLKASDSLILHSAFYPWIWAMLLLIPRIWKRTSWVMWGADIYGKDTWKGKLYHRIKGIVVPRLGAVSALVPGDFADLQKLIGPCNNYVRAFYAPVFEEDAHLSEGRKSSVPSQISKIVLGNSAWPQNDHVPALEWFQRFADHPMELICPLGYPKDTPYKKEVVETGRNLLGAKFKPLEGMLARDEYHAMLSASDIFVLNCRNQQGLGNIYYMLLNGGKVFVRSDSATYSMLKEFGFHVYDTCEIRTMTFEDLIAYSPELAEHNRMHFRKYLSTEACIKEWSTLLERIGALEMAA